MTTAPQHYPERDKLLRDMADCGHDMRATYARDRLAARHEPPNAELSGPQRPARKDEDGPE